MCPKPSNAGKSIRHDVCQALVRTGISAELQFPPVAYITTHRTFTRSLSRAAQNGTYACARAGALGGYESLRRCSSRTSTARAVCVGPAPAGRGAGGRFVECYSVRRVSAARSRIAFRAAIVAMMAVAAPVATTYCAIDDAGITVRTTTCAPSAIAVQILVPRASPTGIPTTDRDDKDGQRVKHADGAGGQHGSCQVLAGFRVRGNDAGSLRRQLRRGSPARVPRATMRGNEARSSPHPGW